MYTTFQVQLKAGLKESLREHAQEVTVNLVSVDRHTGQMKDDRFDGAKCRVQVALLESNMEGKVEVPLITEVENTDASIEIELDEVVVNPKTPSPFKAAAAIVIKKYAEPDDGRQATFSVSVYLSSSPFLPFSLSLSRCARACVCVCVCVTLSLSPSPLSLVVSLEQSDACLESLKKYSLKSVIGFLQAENNGCRTRGGEPYPCQRTRPRRRERRGFGKCLGPRCNRPPERD